MTTATQTSKAARDNSMRRGPEQFSILKGSTTMTSKTAKNTADQTSEQSTSTIQQAQSDVAAAKARLAQLREEQRQLRNQLKAQQGSKLDRVIARQQSDPGKWLVVFLTHRVSARVAAGQPTPEAVDAVLAQYRALLLAEQPATFPSAD